MASTLPAPGAAGGPLRDPDTPAAEAAAAAMQALARAARAFTLYDPANALVRQFLGEYRERTAAAVKTCGGLSVEVRPFELAMGEVALYREADRERSLAFKLYRDGVRRLVFGPAVAWEELLSFLVILAVRYTTVRQQEDDAVTLVRKAELRGITVEAVAGFVPSEANPEPETEELVRAAEHRAIPADWDVPMPRLTQPAALQLREVPAETLAALRQDGSLEASAASALALARDLLAEGARAGWTAENGDVAQFLVEIRDYLLAEGQLPAFRQLLDLCASAPLGALRQAVVASLGDDRTLDLLLGRLPADATRLPAELVALAPALDLGPILRRLARDEPDPRRPVLLGLVEAILPRGAEAVVAQLPSLAADVAEPLVRLLAARAPDHVSPLAARLLEQGSEPLALLGLAALEAGPDPAPVDAVVKLLGGPSEALRIRAAELLARKGDETALPALRQALETPAGRSLREAEALGRALAELAPLPAVRLLAAWLEPKARLLRGVTAEQKVQQWAAVAAFAVVPDALQKDASLAALAEHADAELRRHCLAALAQRRKGRAHGRG